MTRPHFRLARRQARLAMWAEGRGLRLRFGPFETVALMEARGVPWLAVAGR